MLFDFQEGKKRGIFNKNVLHAIDAKHASPVTCYGSIIGEDVRGIVAVRVEYLRNEKLSGNDNQLRPTMTTVPLRFFFDKGKKLPTLIIM